MFQLSPLNTTSIDKLKEEVEQRTTYALKKCELNIFETHKKVENIRLTFEGFTITSMLKGKKVLHSYGAQNTINYLPGESFILPSNSEMIIDFPDADYSNPTQCTALVIENAYLQKQLEYINDVFPRDEESGGIWNLNKDQLWLQNDETIANIGNRLIRIFSGNDPLKDILVDIKLKELVLSLMRLQNYGLISSGLNNNGKTNERFKAVIEYIRRNITSSIDTKELGKMACMSKSVFYRTFINEFGMPPGRMILNEKIRYAKTLMVSGNLKIKEICFALGFSDPNYFSRAFKKMEGVTPGEYLSKIKTQVH
jgi:AraC-like DNA-binding protein